MREECSLEKTSQLSEKLQKPTIIVLVCSKKQSASQNTYVQPQS